MYLPPRDAQAITERVRALEAECGVEIVTLIVGKSDVYPETVWKSFALAASLAALAVTLVDSVRPVWNDSVALLVQALAILGMGALGALAAVAVPRFARLFLRESRATLEVRQFAESEFLARELFDTPGRNAVLILVSVLERRVIVRPDTGFRGRIDEAQWDALVSTMAAALRRGPPGPALLAGLDRLRDLVLAADFVPAAPNNRFPDVPHEDRGA